MILGGGGKFHVTGRVQRGLYRVLHHADDEGFRGVVVELGDGFSDYEFLQDSQDNSDEVLVKASAGMKLTRLGNQLAANGIAGFEFATGIPGCIGGAVRMNAGAYGGEFKDILVSAKVIDNESCMLLRYLCATSCTTLKTCILNKLCCKISFRSFKCASGTRILKWLLLPSLSCQL